MATGAGDAAVFRSSNGLLYPPELWGALEVSAVSGLLRHQALQSLGESPVWPESAEATFKALRVETTPVESAHLIVESGLLSDRDTAPWRADDISDWWEVAAVGQCAECMWMASEVADASKVTIHPSQRSLDALVEAVNGVDRLPAVLASTLLTRYAPEKSVAIADLKATAIRTGRDAGHLLLLSANAEHRSPEGNDPLLTQMATDAATADDWAASYLVRAYAAVERFERARSLVDQFDSRRIMPDGGILEPPLIAGTVGSTFRMVRYLHESGTLYERLDEGVRRDLADTVERNLSKDVMHLAAGTATLALLEPDRVPRSRRLEAIAAIAESIGDSPLTVEQAFAWTYVAEYAAVMGVPITFPGLAEGAVAEWVEKIPDGAAWPIARFIIALRDTGNLSLDHGRLAYALATALRGTLAALKPETTPSTVLFNGVLAVQAVTGEWVHEPRLLAAEAGQRWGACRGGFDGFVRETREERHACNVDASLQVELVRRILRQGAESPYTREQRTSPGEPTAHRPSSNGAP